jgi:hypothetical protein
MDKEIERRRVVKVIVVSPSDVRPERQALDKVVDNLNNLLAAFLGLQIETFRWETDSYPGFHVDGPQGLIDELMKIEKSDVVVGMFWKRFGTPTKKGTTGTEHELMNAYTAWKKSGGKRPQIMLYFKDKKFKPANKKEETQQKKVQKFKRTFHQDEGLSWDFTTLEEFKGLFRDHLTRFLLQNIGTFGSPTFRLLRTHDEIYEANMRIVANAGRILYITGSRSRDRKYLDAIEQKLKAAPALVHYRVLFGPPHHESLRQHLLNLLQQRSPEDRSQGFKTIFLGLYDNSLRQFETFILGNETETLVVLPSLSGVGEYDTAIIFTGIDDVNGFMNFVKQLHASGKTIEQEADIKALTVLKKN